MLVFLVHLLGCKQSIHYSHPVESNGAHVQLLSTARWRSVPGAWCLIKWMYVWLCGSFPFAGSGSFPRRRFRLLPPRLTVTRSPFLPWTKTTRNAKNRGVLAVSTMCECVKV